MNISKMFNFCSLFIRCLYCCVALLYVSSSSSYTLSGAQLQNINADFDEKNKLIDLNIKIKLPNPISGGDHSTSTQAPVFGELIARENGIKCHTVTCPILHFPVPCKKDNGYDKCKKCPNGTYLLDHVDSANLWVDNDSSDSICVAIPRCAPETFIPDATKPWECECNLDKGYYGDDPRSCYLSTAYTQCADNERITHTDGECACNESKYYYGAPGDCTFCGKGSFFHEDSCYCDSDKGYDGTPPYCKYIGHSVEFGGEITDDNIIKHKWFKCYEDKCRCGIDYCSESESRCIRTYNKQELLERINLDYQDGRYSRNHEMCVNEEPKPKGYGASELSGLCLKGKFIGQLSGEGDNFETAFNLRVTNRRDGKSGSIYHLKANTASVRQKSVAKNKMTVIGVEGMKLMAVKENISTDGYTYRLIFKGKGHVLVSNNGLGHKPINMFFRGESDDNIGVRLFSNIPRGKSSKIKEFSRVKLFSFRGIGYVDAVKNDKIVIDEAVITRVSECAD